MKSTIDCVCNWHENHIGKRYTVPFAGKRKMFCKLFIVINIVSIINSNIFVATSYKRDDDGYECKLGSKTPYRCVANYDDSPLKYPGMHQLWVKL